MEATLYKNIKSNYTPSEWADGYISQNWWPELRLDLNLSGIAADFYLFMAVKDGSEYLQERFNEYSQVIAKQLAIYLDAAVGGELRHKNFQGFINSGMTRSIARREWRSKRVDQGIILLEEGYNCFMYEMWGSSYGGPKWGSITKLLLDHLNGEISSVLFVDLALALEHNGGCVFDKVSNYWNLNDLKVVLDANLNEDYSKLLQHGSSWAKEMFNNWIVEEDDIEVTGLVHSDRRYIDKAVSGEVAEGETVTINDKSRNTAWRGKTAKIVKLGIWHKDGKEYPNALIEVDGTKKRINRNILDRTAKNRRFEYIGA